MLTNLKKIAHHVDFVLSFSCTPFEPGKEHLRVIKTDDEFYIQIGTVYVAKRNLKSIINALEVIKKECISEINGTFFEDHYQPHHNHEDDAKYDPEEHNPYSFIKYCIIEDTFKLNGYLEYLIEQFPSLQHKLTSGLSMVFKENKLPVIKNGEISNMTATELADEGYLEDIKAASITETYYETILKLGEAAKNKAPISEILKLIE